MRNKVLMNHLQWSQTNVKLNYPLDYASLTHTPWSPVLLNLSFSLILSVSAACAIIRTIFSVHISVYKFLWFNKCADTWLLAPPSNPTECLATLDQVAEYITQSWLAPLADRAFCSARRRTSNTLSLHYPYLPSSFLLTSTSLSLFLYNPLLGA